MAKTLKQIRESHPQALEEKCPRGLTNRILYYYGRVFNI